MSTTDLPPRANRQSSFRVLPSRNPFFPVRNRLDSSTRSRRTDDSSDEVRSGSSCSVSTPVEQLIDDCHNNPEFQEDEKAGRRIGFYQIIRNVGAGNFARVKLGLHLLAKEQVAIKILNRKNLDSSSEQRFQREIQSIERLHHPNIIRLYEVIKTPKEYFIVTEYVPEGTLQKRITSAGKMNESDAKYFFAQITAAVDHMHSKGIVHRDIKADNIFFANNRLIKLGDFGFSRMAEKNQLLSTACGSPSYAAPELYLKEDYVGIYVDIWAMGVLLYFMVTTLLPFREGDVGRLGRAVKTGNYTIPNFVSNDCQQLIRGMLEVETTERWSINQIRSCTWLKNESFPEALEPLPRALTNFWTCANEDNNDSPASPFNLAHMSPKSSLEAAALKRLNELGINRDLLKKVQSNNLDRLLTNRDSINGTYRVVIHRLQKEESILESNEDSNQTQRKMNRSASIQRLSNSSERPLGRNRRSSCDLPGGARRQNNNDNSDQMSQACTIL